MSGSAGMATSSVLLAQSFKSITRFGRTLHMERTLAVLEDKGFFPGLVSVLEYAGHFRLLYKGGLGS